MACWGPVVNSVKQIKAINSVTQVKAVTFMSCYFCSDFFIIIFKLELLNAI